MNSLFRPQLDCNGQCLEQLCRRVQQELNSFSFMQEEDSVVISTLFGCRQVQAGTVLWREGDPSDYAVFIISGRLELKKNTEFSGHQIVLGILGRGSIAGEQALLESRVRDVTAEVNEDLEMITLTSENFSRMVESFPRTAVNLLRCVLHATATRLRRANDRLTVLF